MAILWPTTVPSAPIYDSYSETAPNYTLRSSTSTGPGKVRRRSSALPVQLTMSLQLSPAQLTAFEDFVLNMLDGGALRFEIPHPRTEATIEARILGGDNLYQVSPGGLGWWRVTFTLEVLP